MYGSEKVVRREIGARLRAARLACRMSQDDVAAVLRRPKTRQAVSRWERGFLPTAMELRELAVIYGESLDWLLLGVKTRPVTGVALQDLFRERDAAQSQWPWGL